MKKRVMRWGTVCCALLAVVGCDIKTSSNQPPDTITRVIHDTVVVPTDSLNYASAIRLPVTLPILDAFLLDSTFLSDLRMHVGLAETEIDTLRRLAHNETSRLREHNADDYIGRTSAATQLALRQVQSVIGSERTEQIFALVREHWAGLSSAGADSTYASTIDSASSSPIEQTMTEAPANAIPGDTRIVINAPSYRMDLFKDGELLRSYTIGIGYPEFPLPTGIRTARQIIFNPTWTPPDEPWVEPSRVGKKVGAGKNPLGIAKVPIGLPSLIHSGKTKAMLGTFASHGCVGLTDEQMREFSKQLAEMGGATLTDSMIAYFAKHPTETHTIDLAHPIPVELRYETIVAQNGEVHVYRDVYGYATNTQQSLQRTLATFNVPLTQLTQEEQGTLDSALNRMSITLPGTRDSAMTASTGSTDTLQSTGKDLSKITTTVKGPKEITVKVAALNGKGYPEPVESTKKVASPSPVYMPRSRFAFPYPVVST